jgi:hypothetical protein
MRRRSPSPATPPRLTPGKSLWGRKISLSPSTPPRLTPGKSPVREKEKEEEISLSTHDTQTDSR